MPDHMDALMNILPHEDAMDDEDDDLLTPIHQVLVWVMEGCGKMNLQSIYRAYAKFQKANPKIVRPLTEAMEATIRRVLQDHCSTSKQYKGGTDLFVHHEHGFWSCKAKSPKADEL